MGQRAGEAWHSDMGYTANPPRGTMLYAHEVPVQDYDLPLRRLMHRTTFSTSRAA